MPFLSNAIALTLTLLGTGAWAVLLVYAMSGFSKFMPLTLLQEPPVELHARAICRRALTLEDIATCAQWRSAIAAEAMVVLTAISVVLAIAGAALLLHQLRLARQSADAATQATEQMTKQSRVMEASHRPWVVATELRSANINCYGDNLTVSFKVTLKNIGLSPAHYVNFATELYVYMEIDEDWGEAKESVKSADWGQDFQNIIMPGETREIAFFKFFRKDEFQHGIALHALVYIHYSDSGDTLTGETEHRWTIAKRVTGDSSQAYHPIELVSGSSYTPEIGQMFTIRGS